MGGRCVRERNHLQVSETRFSFFFILTTVGGDQWDGRIVKRTTITISLDVSLYQRQGAISEIRLFILFYIFLVGYLFLKDNCHH